MSLTKSCARRFGDTCRLPNVITIQKAIIIDKNWVVKINSSTDKIIELGLTTYDKMDHNDTKKLE
jgi:hypothetical protein